MRVRGDGLRVRDGVHRTVRPVLLNPPAVASVDDPTVSKRRSPVQPRPRTCEQTAMHTSLPYVLLTWTSWEGKRTRCAHPVRRFETEPRTPVAPACIDWTLRLAVQVDVSMRAGQGGWVRVHVSGSSCSCTLQRPQNAPRTGRRAQLEVKNRPFWPVDRDSNEDRSSHEP